MQVTEILADLEKMVKAGDHVKISQSVDGKVWATGDTMTAAQAEAAVKIISSIAAEYGVAYHVAVTRVDIF